MKRDICGYIYNVIQLQPLPSGKLVLFGYMLHLCGVGKLISVTRGYLLALNSYHRSMQHILEIFLDKF